MRPSLHCNFETLVMKSVNKNVVVGTEFESSIHVSVWKMKWRLGPASEQREHVAT